MKKNIILTIFNILCAIVITICTTLNIMVVSDNKDTIENKLLNAYDKYYISAESLLDSIGIDVDNPVFETDEGSKYLNDKFTVDSLYNKYKN